MLIDAHAHLDSYGDLLDSALEEIDRNRILTISNSIDVPSYRRNLDVADRTELVVPTFGVHPWSAPEYSGRLDELEPLVESSPMIGEVGLDFHFVEDPSRYPDQLEVLEFFLDAAKRLGKILTLHTKGADNEVLGLLDRYGIDRAIVHWYSGDIETLEAMIERGLYFTVGYEVLVTKHIRDIAEVIPTDRILSETDNPGGPEWLIGEARMPSLVVEVVRELAQIKGVTHDEMVDRVRENLQTLIHGDSRMAAVCEILDRET